MIPAIVLLAGLGATYTVWTLGKKDLRQIQQEKLEFRVNEISDNIQSRLKSYEQVLLGASGLYAASRSVEPEEFRIYVDKLKLGTNFPGIQGVGFSQLIRPAEKWHHIERERRQGFPNYVLRPTGEREIYTAIIHLEPFDWRNQRAFGFDMYSEPVRRVAMRQAWEEGSTVISGKVTLVQETNEDTQAGFLMYVPVYRNGARLDHAGDRLANLVGWTFSPFRMNDLMKGVLGKKYGETKATVDLEIYDGGEINPKNQLYDSNLVEQGSETAYGAFHASRKIAFGKHVWTVMVHALPEFEQQAAKDQLHLISNVGVTLSILIAALAWLLLNGRAHALALAKNMTVLLREEEAKLRKLSGLNQAILDSANYMVISTGTDGVIRTFNRAAERMLGYPEEDVVGKATPAIFHDAQEVIRHAKNLSHELGVPVAPGFEAFIAKARLGQVDECEWNYIRKDGSRFPVLLSVTALRSEDGKITGYLGVGQNIEESKRAQEKLDNLHKEMRLLLESTGEGIYGIDIHGHCTFINGAAARMMDYEVADMLGKDMHELIHHQHVDGSAYAVEDCPIYQALRDGQHRRVESEVFWRKGEKPLPVEYASYPVVEAGEITGAVITFSDITERRKIEKMKSEFISTVSHELRTPLTSIRGALALLAGGVAGELSATVKPLIDVAHKNSQRLILLVNDILDMEKIEAGKMEFDIQPVKLMPLLKQALDGNRAYAEQFKVSYELASEMPEVMVKVDANRLMQVFANLLSNAAKFSPPGGKVSIAVARVGQRIRVAVMDSGCGISDEFKSRIFQKFAQADVSNTSNTGGTGLGLSITKAMVENMGGSIGFDSEPNVQTTFYVDLPECQEEKDH
ncbi:MAG: CHASE domain-containing protein [Sterolibacterium sp.]|nr:CHASE domain-containing protein [Sterolibacterium sp.]